MFLSEGEAVDEDSDFKCKNVNQGVSSDQKFCYLGIKYVAIHRIWNIIALYFRSPSGYSFSLNPLCKFIPIRQGGGSIICTCNNTF